MFQNLDLRRAAEPSPRLRGPCSARCSSANTSGRTPTSSTRLAADRPAAAGRAGLPGAAARQDPRQRLHRRLHEPRRRRQRPRSATICAQAVALLKKAGYEQRGGRMVNAATGAAASFEILLNGDTLSGVVAQYQESLKRIGIEMRIRPVDPSQYINRIRARDYDMIYSGLAQSLSPGNEQYDYFGSDAADKPARRTMPASRIRRSTRSSRRRAGQGPRHPARRHARARPGADGEPVHHPLLRLKDERAAYWDRFSHPEPCPNTRSAGRHLVVGRGQGRQGAGAAMSTALSRRAARPPQGAGRRRLAGACRRRAFAASRPTRRCMASRPSAI